MSRLLIECVSFLDLRNHITIGQGKFDSLLLRDNLASVAGSTRLLRLRLSPTHLTSRDAPTGIRSLNFLEKSFGASKTKIGFAKRILFAAGTIPLGIEAVLRTAKCSYRDSNPGLRRSPCHADIAWHIN